MCESEGGRRGGRYQIEAADIDMAELQENLNVPNKIAEELVKTNIVTSPYLGWHNVRGQLASWTDVQEVNEM